MMVFYLGKLDSNHEFHQTSSSVLCLGVQDDPWSPQMSFMSFIWMLHYRNSPTGKINTCGVPYSKHHFRWRKHVRSWSHLARYNNVLYIKIWLVFHGFGAGHLRGSRLLLFFAFYYENNIVWVGGGVGWDNNVICTSTHMWCNIFVRSLAFHSHPHIRHATLL